MVTKKLKEHECTNNSLLFLNYLVMLIEHCRNTLEYDLKIGFDLWEPSSESYSISSVRWSFCIIYSNLKLDVEYIFDYFDEYIKIFKTHQNKEYEEELIEFLNNKLK